MTTAQLFHQDTDILRLLIFSVGLFSGIAVGFVGGGTFEAWRKGGSRALRNALGHAYRTELALRTALLRAGISLPIIAETTSEVSESDGVRSSRSGQSL